MEKTKKKPIEIIFVLLILAYIFIRLVITPFMSIKQVYPIWLGYSTQVVMYFLICVMIVLKHNELEKYHINLLVILFIIPSTILYVLFFFSRIPIYISILWIAISTALVSYLIITRTPLRKPTRIDAIWILCSLGIGILLPIIVKVFDPRSQIADPTGGPIMSGGNIFAYFELFMATAAILEETFFRGFLWGWLKKFKIKEVFIFIIQAILFWIGHFNYFSHPFTFWISLPVFTIIVSLLAWKSRSIAAPLLVHSLYNTIGLVF